MFRTPPSAGLYHNWEKNPIPNVISYDSTTHHGIHNLLLWTRPLASMWPKTSACVCSQWRDVPEDCEFLKLRTYETTTTLHFPLSFFSGLKVGRVHKWQQNNSCLSRKLDIDSSIKLINPAPLLYIRHTRQHPAATGSCTLNTLPRATKPPTAAVTPPAAMRPEIIITLLPTDFLRGKVLEGVPLLVRFSTCQSLLFLESSLINAGTVDPFREYIYSSRGSQLLRRKNINLVGAVS